MQNRKSARSAALGTMARQMPTLACLALAGTLMTSPRTYAQAATQVRIVVGAPAGSGLDERVRDFTPFLATALGKSVAVDNRSGQSASAIAATIAKEPADGSVLYVGASGIALPPTSNSTTGNFDPAKDLTPVSLVVVLQAVAIASISTRANNVPELIALANAPDSGLEILTEGFGTHSHLAAAWFARDAKANFKYQHMD